MASGYESTMTLGPFKGIRQDTGGEGLGLAYAWEAENCDVSGGGLRPLKGGAPWGEAAPAPIGTLMRLYRRYYGEESEKEVLVAAAGNTLYTRKGSETGWTVVSGITLQSDDMDWVTYEVNREGDESPVDVLLMTNAQDGMICLYGDDLHGALINTPYKFGILARHAERIWGGAIPGHPDTLVYSAPYDPFDWAANTEIPEDGGGEVLQPSWDGDSFLALRPFGSQLLAIKGRKIWRILGTDPGSYAMKEQYGEGALCENSVVVAEDAAYMLGREGLLRYDGTLCRAFYPSAVKGIWQRVNLAALPGACGAVSRGRLYMALPLDGAQVNNAILEYDLTEGTFMLRTGVGVKAFLPMAQGLYYTAPAAPCGVFALGAGEALGLKWVSGWQEQGSKETVKSGFRAYLAARSTEDTVVTLTLETEKGSKVKTAALPAGGQVRRVRLPLRGRRWRLTLEAAPGQDWTLLAGVQILMDQDQGQG